MFISSTYDEFGSIIHLFSHLTFHLSPLLAPIRRVEPASFLCQQMNREEQILMIISSTYDNWINIHLFSHLPRYRQVWGVWTSDATVVTPDNGATSHLAIALETLVAIGLTSRHAVCLVTTANGKNDPFWGLTQVLHRNDYVLHVGMTTCAKALTFCN